MVLLTRRTTGSGVLRVGMAASYDRLYKASPRRNRGHPNVVAAREKNMATYAAFLRGINVGGHTVKNDRLRELFEELGFQDVRTFLASGNLIFQNDDVGDSVLEERIESRLRDGLGYDVPTFVRTAEQVTAIADHTPFPDAPADGRLHIAFLRAEPAAATKNEVAALTKATDRVAFRDRELYWFVAGRFMDSALSDPAVDRLLGGDWTVRTARTVRRVTAKLLH